MTRFAVQISQGAHSRKMPPGVPPFLKEVDDRKFSILLPSHKLYLCLWESGGCSPQ